MSSTPATPAPAATEMSAEADEATEAATAAASATPGRPRIVVGVDGSDHSKEALRWAARLAASESARLDVIAAWDFPTLFGWAPPEFHPQDDIEKSLADTVDEVFGPNRPADLRIRAFEGAAASVLLGAAKGALMVVVGSRGRGGFTGLLLGSVSARVAEHASCPVLVVHEPAREDSEA